MDDRRVQPLGDDWNHPARGVLAIIDPETQLIEVVVTGPWDHPKWLQARAMINKCLTERPAGILLDLTYLDDPYAQSASLWFTAARQAEQCQPRPVCQGELRPAVHSKSAGQGEFRIESVDCCC